MASGARAHSRRELLADAAIDVLAREGGRGLTHRAVDREAQVPLGTTKNYYPTRNALLVAAARRMADEHSAAVQVLRDTTPAEVRPDQVRELYPAMLTRAVHGDRTQTLALFELYLEGVRRPEVREALGEMVRANAEGVIAVHRSAGLDTTPRDAALLDAYFLGVSISLLALPDDALGKLGLDDSQDLGRGLFDAAVPSASEQRDEHGRGSVEQPVGQEQQPGVAVPRPQVAEQEPGDPLVGDD
ncbi:TetR/AcrR family transcriptional regulator [Allokutzneria sp. NRRL B-24872]|uniref:TetR/AcrR family transcriptional regulator n=1 Tax=Allokutzneria sp. NRRL B-24872 TaxID=1137961 RepID=UPI001FEFAC4C|nr:TetR/AcrR family transcriptional regulator [Allokutzneria sp. NRRL B-24872]